MEIVRCSNCGHELDRCTCPTPEEALRRQVDKEIIEKLTEPGSGSPKIKLSDIILESVRRMSLRDGDVVLVSLDDKVPAMVSAQAHQVFTNVLKEVGHNCRVVILPPKTKVEILGKEKLEKMMAGDYEGD